MDADNSRRRFLKHVSTAGAALTSLSFRGGSSSASTGSAPDPTASATTSRPVFRLKYGLYDDFDGNGCLQYRDGKHLAEAGKLSRRLWTTEFHPTSDVPESLKVVETGPFSGGSHPLAAAMESRAAAGSGYVVRMECGEYRGTAAYEPEVFVLGNPDNIAFVDYQSWSADVLLSSESTASKVHFAMDYHCAIHRGVSWYCYFGLRRDSVGELVAVAFWNDKNNRVSEWRSRPAGVEDTWHNLRMDITVGDDKKVRIDWHLDGELFVSAEPPYMEHLLDSDNLRFGPKRSFGMGRQTGGHGVVYIDNVHAVYTDRAPEPHFTSAAIVNAASFQPGLIAPGEIITIFGADLGPAELAQAYYEDGTLPTAVGETRVLFDGVPAPLIYAKRDQTSAVVPYGVPSTTRIEVEHSEQKSDAVLVRVEYAVPALFCYSHGTGQAVIVNQDGSLNGPDRRSDKGSVVSVFLTGDGVVFPQISDGQLPTGPNYPASAHSSRVLIGGTECPIVFRGLVYAGVTQLNVRIPLGAPAGERVSLEAIVGNNHSQPGVFLAIQ